MEGGLEVFDPDIEVYLHLLVIGTGGPSRWRVILLELGGQAGVGIGSAQLGPLGILESDIPAEQIPVEEG